MPETNLERAKKVLTNLKNHKDGVEMFINSRYEYITVDILTMFMGSAPLNDIVRELVSEGKVELIQPILPSEEYGDQQLRISDKGLMSLRKS